MRALIFVPFVIQAIVILLDEYIFHIKRGLPKWERIGHPLDTLSVIGCFAFVLFVPYEAGMIKYYVLTAIFSCLLITKDEFVHKHHCPAAEQWLHAILFVNHSVLLAAMGLMWPKIHGQDVFAWLPVADALIPFLWAQAIFAGLFFLYQVIYWNFIYVEKIVHENHQ
ncbi:MAG TPA: hypothetical protein VMR37_06455 [Rhabdochlamydiaceae bacterium]|jgi:hypothetical protein|nr:hypothetical protein [Rhabdochlamydiaceae bacterium]